MAAGVFIVCLSVMQNGSKVVCVDDVFPAWARASYTALPVKGVTYTVRSMCDYDCIFAFTVVKRTAKMVTISSPSRRTVARKVRVYDGVEHLDPHGNYSMSPVLSATDRAAA